VKAVSNQRAVEVEGLVRRHQGSVRGFLPFLGCPASEVDDLVQDAFLSVLRAGFEQRSEAATSAYLRRVARNLFLKSLRLARQRPPVVDLDGAERAWVAFEGDDRGESYLNALRACLEAVDARAREVLQLRYRGELPRAAIAGRLGLSESGVKSVLVRTRRRLRACVERRLAR
jgi:RNA polymerase sigma-70 factor (ECF subfamily)